ncbi:MAG TPA: dihydropteroate synthase [Sporichthyaceae bacterium]|nr:dihydropteroate synthase [Sporichthyaceae bacterium]
MAAAVRLIAPGLPVLDRCLVMGVVNVTPDSFSDGGRFFDPDTAVAHGLAMLTQGADLIDVGGESTRPGAGRVEPVEELRRVVPVVAALSVAGAFVAVDTTRAAVAQAALAAGARMVNDISGGLADPAMVPLVAAARVPYVLMHWRGPSADMSSRAVYNDVVTDVHAELRQRLDAVVTAGVDPELVVLDPGLGFAKTAEHNWALLHGLRRLTDLGRPVLVAASRKAFLGRLLGDGEVLRDPPGRDDATAATSALAAAAGAWCVRVHAVRRSRDAVEVAARWVHG